MCAKNKKILNDKIMGDKIMKNYWEIFSVSKDSAAAYAVFLINRKIRAWSFSEITPKR
jgi:hypothetical protein